MIERPRLGALLRAGALVAALALVPMAAQADDSSADPAADPKVVLELFTSQGCSSCPSADALLGELSDTRDDVVALSFHVDYWDYIGWEDPFASAETTARQRAYAKSLGIAYVYTPQLVIDGAHHVVGSRRDDVRNAIAASKTVKARRVPVSLASTASGGLAIEIGADDSYYGSARVLLVAIDRAHTTPVDAGENRGRTLTNYNVVRDFQSIGKWTGGATSLELGPEATKGLGDGCAVLVQQGWEGHGRILGADLVWLDGV